MDWMLAETPRDYVAAHRRGLESPEVEVRGLAGRILRGRGPGDFERLTDDPGRRLVFVLDSGGLAALLGRSGWEMLEVVGYTPGHVRELLEGGRRFELVVFPADRRVHRATWENAVELTRVLHPALPERLRLHLPGLRTHDFEEIQARAPVSFAEIRRAGREDPRWIDAGGYLAGEQRLWEARALLYLELQLRELFAGDGFTRSPEGARGPAEWFRLDQPLEELGEVERLPLEVRPPGD